MKRDMELIRKVILAAEAHPEGWAPDAMIDGYDESQILYHNYLIVDSGLAEGSDVTDSSCSGPAWMITHLNSAGHDFAESCRNEFIWNEVITEMKQKGLVSASVDLVKRMLDKRIRKALLDE